MNADRILEKEIRRIRRALKESKLFEDGKIELGQGNKVTAFQTYKANDPSNKDGNPTLNQTLSPSEFGGDINSANAAFGIIAQYLLARNKDWTLDEQNTKTWDFTVESHGNGSKLSKISIVTDKGELIVVAGEGNSKFSVEDFLMGVADWYVKSKAKGQDPKTIAEIIKKQYANLYQALLSVSQNLDMAIEE